MSWAAPEGADVYFHAAYHRLHEANGDGEAWCAGHARDGASMIAPGMRMRIDGGEDFDLQSCNGYGGPLLVGGDARFLDEAWSAWRARAAADRIVAAMFRLHPVLDNARWLPADATVREDRKTVFVPLGEGLEAACARAEPRHRNMVNKARREGTLVSWDEPRAWPAFESLYAQAMERLGAASHLRFGAAYFAGLRALDFAHVACIWDGDALVAASVFLFGPQLAHYHLSARRPDAPNFAAGFLLQAALERAAGLGLDGLHLGGGTGTSEDDPLLKFKRSLGGELLPFRVARVIVDGDGFARLVERWRAKHHAEPRWLLGYRQPHEVP